MKTQQVVEKMEQMKLELKMLESNDSSVASIWKKKCLDLFEVCQTLKTENEELRDRCKELIAALRWFEPLHQVVEHLGEAHREQRIGMEAGLASQQMQFD